MDWGTIDIVSPWGEWHWEGWAAFWVAMVFVALCLIATFFIVRSCRV